MPDPRTDEIAREAARLIETGQIEGVDAAIHKAARVLGFHRVPLPGTGRVRKHAQMMAMQSLGEARYLEKQRELLRTAEELMSAIDVALPEVATLFVGRAAEGHIDAGAELHIRLYTRLSMSEITRALAGFGYDEPKYNTAETRFGRLDQLRYIEDAATIVLTRCLPEMAGDSPRDLFSGKVTHTLTLKQLRARLADRQAS